MLTNLLLSFLFLSSPPADQGPPVPALAIAQDEGGELPDKRPEVKELLDQLGAAIGERGDKDPEAIATIDKLVQEFPKSGPKDRGAIVTGIARCFEVNRQELEEGVPNVQLFMAAAVSLGEMGPESVKVLAKWIGNKKLDQYAQLQRQLILSLGKTKHEEALKPLLGCLDHHDPAIVAAGAEALGQYEKSELKVRKSVFEELLKVLTSAKGQMDQDVNDTIARERYDVIGAPLITSLGRLSGQDIRDPEEWQRWWNKNKKEDWDKGGGK